MFFASINQCVSFWNTMEGGWIRAGHVSIFGIFVSWKVKFNAYLRSMNCSVEKWSPRILERIRTSLTVSCTKWSIIGVDNDLSQMDKLKQSPLLSHGMIALSVNISQEEERRKGTSTLDWSRQIQLADASTIGALHGNNAAVSRLSRTQTKSFLPWIHHLSVR